MPSIFTQIELTALSGIPDESAMNTFMFGTSDTNPPDGADINDVFTMMVDFYNTKSGTATAPVCSYLSSSISRAVGGVKVTMYNGAMLNGALGAPISEASFTLGAVAGVGTPMPQEVAVALSYHGATAGIPEHAPGGSRPKASHRGRIYLGPLYSNAFATDAPTGHVLVAPVFRTDLCEAAKHLMTDSQARNLAWRVRSIKLQTAYAIIGGHVDDAPDTIRSRGFKPSLRTTFGQLSRTADEANIPALHFGESV